RLARDRDGPVAVVAVVGEEEHRPDDQDDRVDLQILLQRVETGREALRGKQREDEVAEIKRGKKGERGKREVDEVDDPRDERCLLSQHSIAFKRANPVVLRSSRGERLSEFSKKLLVRVRDRIPPVLRRRAPPCPLPQGLAQAGVRQPFAKYA